MGHEFVGEVVAHGPGCSGQFPPGTRVTAMPVLTRGDARQVIGAHPEAPGSFGEQFVVSEALARRVPDDVDPDAVAVCDAFAVGEGYVALSGIEPGQLPLVVGAGAIGLSAVAAMAARGVGPVLVADFNDDRLALAATFGQTIAVNPSARSPYDAWQELAAERSVPSPPVIFECVGATGLLQRIVEACPMGSRIYAAGGWYTGDTLDVTTATTKGVLVQFGGAPGRRHGTAPSRPSCRANSTHGQASGWSSGSTVCPTPLTWPARRRARRGSSSTPTGDAGNHHNENGSLRNDKEDRCRTWT
jgi:threonine dehydrogenase-like Zn-dependent dehydrogenase